MRVSQFVICALLVGLAEVALAGPFEDAVIEARQNAGVVRVPAYAEFFQKNTQGMEQTLASIWKLIVAKGGSVRQLNVVRAGDSTVVYTYTISGGLVVVRSATGTP
jgi:hypothetical protein